MHEIKTSNNRPVIFLTKQATISKELNILCSVLYQFLFIC